jgi:hypothetical protein
MARKRHLAFDQPARIIYDLALPFRRGNAMSNKARLRPHEKKRHASRAGLVFLGIIVAIFALSLALAATGHGTFLSNFGNH